MRTHLSLIAIAMLAGTAHADRVPNKPAPAKPAPAKPTAPTAAKPAKEIPTTPVSRDQLPAGANVRGKTFERALSYRDRRGTHYVVMSATDTERGAGEESSHSRTIYLDDWIVASAGATPRSALPVRDMVNDCQMGALSAHFHPASIDVTDLDGDGIAELAFGYELACRSDVSPATYKLLILVDGRKHILRGTTRVESYGSPQLGGTFVPEPVEARWPAGLFAHAQQRWNETCDDLTSPPQDGH